MITDSTRDTSLDELKAAIGNCTQFGITRIQRLLGWGYNRTCHLAEYGVKSGQLVTCGEFDHLYMFKAEEKNKSWVGHVQMEVETALNMPDRELKEWWGDDVKGVRAELTGLKESGRIYLHTEGCDNEDPVTGKCLRHDQD